jgi:hypothetical protein
MSYWLGYLLILGGGLAVGGALLAAGRHRLAQNVALVWLALFLSLMAAELYFKLIFAQSENRNFTLASRNWFERYWRLNSLGYRDVEWSAADLAARRKILVIGDSFAAGQGIENVADRFSNRLGALLGEEYLVMNIAQPGFSTKEELDRLRGFPYKPQILILQYYLNDIRYAAEGRNLIFTPPDTSPPGLVAPLVNHSYAANFIYWRAILLGPAEWQGDSATWLRAAYADPEIWWLHQQELLAIADGAASERVELIVVVFPLLTDVAGSREMTGQVVALYTERGVPVLDVGELAQNIPPEELVVHRLDAHPGKRLHAAVADALYELIAQVEDR